MAALVATALVCFARAHEVGLSRGTYAIDGDHVTAELVLSRRELSGALPELDADRDGHLAASEIASARPAFQRAVVDRIHVRSGDAPCSGLLTEAHLAEDDGLIVRATYACSAPITRATLDFPLLDDLTHGHRHIARVTGAIQVVETVLSRNQRTLHLTAPPGAAEAFARRQRPSMLRLGFQRLLVGYLHLGFLVGLLLPRGRPRALLSAVASFALGHSVTLSLAALGVWTPRSAILAPAVALSLVYLGVETLFASDARARWRIAFSFGLVHGFALATSLTALSLPRAELPTALVGFNAGVLLAELAVVVLAIPLLARARRWPPFDKHADRALAGVVALVGLVSLINAALGAA